jgi:hypothetical protein
LARFRAAVQRQLRCETGVAAAGREIARRRTARAETPGMMHRQGTLEIMERDVYLWT